MNLLPLTRDEANAFNRARFWRVVRDESETTWPPRLVFSAAASFAAKGSRLWPSLRTRGAALVAFLAAFFTGVALTGGVSTTGGGFEEGSGRGEGSASAIMYDHGIPVIWAGSRDDGEREAAWWLMRAWRDHRAAMAPARQEGA